jgi:Protein of unknown function (DUF3592)
MRLVGSVLEDSKAGLARGINRVMVVISLAVGSAFILVGGYWVHRLHLDEFIFNRATAQGQVVENRKNLRGRTSYKAVVRFNAHGGGDVTVADWIALNPASFSVGQNVTLFYDPEDPQSAMIDRGWKNYLAPGIPGLMGFLMILGGMQRLRRILVEKRRKPQAP